MRRITGLRKRSFTHLPMHCWQWNRIGLLLMGLLYSLTPAYASEPLTGKEIMHRSIITHYQYPFIMETQSMVLVDRDGHRDARKLTRYFRREADGTLKTLLRFTDPETIRNTALLAIHYPDGHSSMQIFLPALGRRLIDYHSSDRNGKFLGSDFAIEDLLPDQMKDYHYQRKKDRHQDDMHWFVIDALPKSQAVSDATGYTRRRIFVRQTNLMIDRVDFFSDGQLIKRMTRHDIQRVNRTMWAANMVRMESFRDHHSSVINTNSRIFGKDYVPASLFAPDEITDHTSRLPQQ
ncbi:MAG: outer membrane lipoprotein-sorting protein [Mariprofundales bacterium]|nr:outer membrane lipoprotein-sorting protein [Mariprofundales bacterium]